jgi:L-alanine-DL-glutamate epimerase-like enolase superfamily enzyme
MTEREDLAGVRIERLHAAAYTVPTDAPESDGTLQWDSTTMVVVHATAGGVVGCGYSYTTAAATVLIEELLHDLVVGREVADVAGSWGAMVRATRNLGRPGITSCAIAAVDNALWDLKARVLGIPTALLLGRVRDAVPAYGSGGFSSYDRTRLEEQLGGWAADGFSMVKMKVGRDPDADIHRAGWARDAIGDDVELFVDANGAYSRKYAEAMAAEFHRLGVTWFEEPVVSDDLDGLRLIRDRGPGGMDIAAGEYGFDLVYFRRMLEAGAVDVLQADVTRCAGVTGLLAVGSLCQAANVPLSCHCAPAAHLHAACAIPAVRHLEWFHDHVRIERLLFDGAPEPSDGVVAPDLSRPGSGLTFRERDAEPYRVR